MTLAPQLVFFGDSLSDNGNLYAQSQGLLDDLFRDAVSGFEGRASDGPTWAEWLTTYTGFSALNYAVAGAEAAGTQTLLDFAEDFGALPFLLVPQDDPALSWDMNLGAQIDRFAADMLGADLSDTTGIILIGGNDYGALRNVIPGLDPVQALAALADTLVSSVAATLAEALTLEQMGLEQVVVTSLPVAEFFPIINGVGGIVTAAIGGLFDVHNNLLQDGVNLLANLGADISFLDLGPITGAIAEDPWQFSFTLPYWYFTQDADAAPYDAFEPSEAAFWDDIHPSTQAHQIIAAFTVTASDPSVRQLHGSGDDDALIFGQYYDLDYPDDDSPILSFGGRGHDTIVSHDGDDTVFGGTGDDKITTHDGDDLIAGGRGYNSVVSGDGNDIVMLNGRQDFANTGAGDDIIVLGRGDEYVLAGDGDDCAFIFLDWLDLGQHFLEVSFLGGQDGYDRLYIIGSAISDRNHMDEPDHVLALLNLHVSGFEEIHLLPDFDTDPDSPLPAVTDQMIEAAAWGLLPDALVGL